RTTPLSQWEEVAAKFDLCIREAVFKILGTTFPGESYTQACVSTKIGGLGIRRVVDHANGAFAASWHESCRQAQETWEVPALCSGEYVPQIQSSADVDCKSLEGLVSRSSARDAQRMLFTPTPGSPPCLLR